MLGTRGTGFETCLGVNDDSYLPYYLRQLPPWADDRVVTARQLIVTTRDLNPVGTESK